MSLTRLVLRHRLHVQLSSLLKGCYKLQLRAHQNYWYSQVRAKFLRRRPKVIVALEEISVTYSVIVISSNGCIPEWHPLLLSHGILQTEDFPKFQRLMKCVVESFSLVAFGNIHERDHLVLSEWLPSSTLAFLLLFSK